MRAPDLIRRLAPTMQSTMQDYPLTIASILRYAVGVHGDRTVTTSTGTGGASGYRHASYAELGRRAARLANALRRIGINGDQRVGTFMWNNQEHLEAYVAVPAMGAVLHTLNVRLFPEQIEFVAYEAEDQVVIADLSLAPVLAPALRSMEAVHTVIAVGDGDLDLLRVPGKTLVRYHELLAAESRPERALRGEACAPRMVARGRTPRTIRQINAALCMRRICGGREISMNSRDVEYSSRRVSRRC